MEKFTFNELPDAVAEVLSTVRNLEKILLEKVTTTPTVADEFLNIMQTAKMLNLTVPTIYGLVHQAKIPVSKKGRRLYFSRQELRDWIKSGHRKTLAEIANEAEQYCKSKKG